MKKYISMLILLVSAGICNAETKIIEVLPGMKVKIESSLGAQVGISKIIVEKWTYKDGKKNYSNGNIAAESYSFDNEGKVNETIKVDSYGEACFYNPWVNLEPATYEFDIIAFDKKGHISGRMDVSPGSGQCIHGFPYIISNPIVSGIYHSTSTTKAHMIGESAFKDSNGTITVK